MKEQIISILPPSQDTLLLFFLVISSNKDLVSVSFKHVHKFSVNVSHVTIKNLIRIMMKKFKKWTLWKRVNLNYVVLSIYNGGYPMFLFQKGLSLIFNGFLMDFLSTLSLNYQKMVNGWKITSDHYPEAVKNTFFYKTPPVATSHYTLV